MSQSWIVEWSSSLETYILVDDELDGCHMLLTKRTGLVDDAKSYHELIDIDHLGYAMRKKLPGSFSAH